MTKGLRKGLNSYGDAGFSLFLRKAFIKTAGYSDSALDRQIETSARLAAARTLAASLIPLLHRV